MVDRPTRRVDRPTKRGELVQGNSPEGWTVYEAGSDSLHVLNASAKAIWELCDGETSTREIAEAVAEIAGYGPRRALEEVLETIQVLRERGLVS